MSESPVGDLVARLGISGVTGASPLRSGLGGNGLWRLHRNAGDLVLRAFPPGAPVAVAEREEQAHRFARDHGLRAPAVHSCQVVGDRPVLIMDWTPGDLLADSLWSGNDPDDLGRRSGAVLARLHAIAAPPPPLIAARSWIHWPSSIPELTDQLRPYDSGHVTLHLDFHPENLIIAPDGEIVILDWANCQVGPPQADLARTLAILEMIMVVVPELTEVGRRAAERYRDGFLTAYQDAGGNLTIPDACGPGPMRGNTATWRAAGCHPGIWTASRIVTGS